MSRPGWLVSTVVGTLLLAGCSGEEPSASPPSEPPSTTPTVSPPTPTPPSLPASARKPNKAGAVAFAHHYIDLVNFASRTGDLVTLREASAASCRSCQNILKILEGVYGRGGRVQGGHWTVRSYSAVAAGPRATWLVAMNLRADSQVVRSGAKAAPEERAGGDFSASLYAKRSVHAWQVKRLVRDQ